jgi:hypothetical protein
MSNVEAKRDSWVASTQEVPDSILGPKSGQPD